MKPRPVLGVQGSEHAVFYSGEALLGVLEFRDPVVRDRDDVSPTVIGVWPMWSVRASDPFDEQGFVVDHPLCRVRHSRYYADPFVMPTSG